MYLTYYSEIREQLALETSQTWQKECGSAYITSRPRDSSPHRTSRTFVAFGVVERSRPNPSVIKLSNECVFTAWTLDFSHLRSHLLRH
jgi:hypothetical protein